MSMRAVTAAAAVVTLVAGCSAAAPGPSPEDADGTASPSQTPSRSAGAPGQAPAPEPASAPEPAAAPESTATPAPTTTVTVAGDIMLGRRVGAAAAAAGDPGAPLRPLQRRLARADITVGNLESTLSRAGAPRQGDDSFAADPAVLGGLGDAGFDVLSLANNHTGDFGPRALLRTLRQVDRSGIAALGAGHDRAAAWEPVVVTRHGVRFGFVAFNAIGETPRATPRSPGAASVRMPPRTGPLDTGDLRRLTGLVRRLHREDRADVVIVLAHWGEQYTHTPVPAQRRVGRALVDAGADAVVGGHPHWVQRVQRHRGRPIVHSLGNLVFDMDFSRQTQEGVLARLEFRGDELAVVRFTPYVIGAGFAPRPVTGPRARTILESLGVPRRLRVSR